MSRLAYAFVAIIFGILGASFLASTALLVREFQGGDWQTLIIAHSHLFFFFPVFGVLALAAFYIPSVVFTDFYWQRRKPIRLGRTRFVAVALLAAGLSAYLALQLSEKSPHGIWEVAPATLEADRKAGPVAVPDCLTLETPAAACQRRPILDVLQDLRKEGVKRTTVTEFARNCNPDPLLTRPVSDAEPRYCFPAGKRLPAIECCKVQRAFAGHVDRYFADIRTRSQIANYEAILTACKTFFVIVLLIIGLLLVAWQKRIEELYSAQIPALERGVIVGAIAMLFWLLMDYGYQQTADVLFGREKPGFPFRHSIVVAPWAALLVLYFVKRTGGMLFNLAQLSTIAASAYAALRYEQISNVSVRMLGSGAETGVFIGLIVLAIFSLGLVYGPWYLPLPPQGKRRGTATKHSAVDESGSHSPHQHSASSTGPLS